MNPGNITWKQIPIMTKMACGAREAMTYDEGRNIRFKVGGKPMRYVEVELDASDTYTVRYLRIKRGSYARIVLEEKTFVYADMLGEIIYHMVNK